jgi:hypothetical protein
MCWFGVVGSGYGFVTASKGRFFIGFNFLQPAFIRGNIFVRDAKVQDRAGEGSDGAVNAHAKPGVAFLGGVEGRRDVF